MRKKQNFFNKLISEENLYCAYNKAQKLQKIVQKNYKNPEVAPFQASIRPSPAVVVEVVVGIDVVDVVVVVAAKANRPEHVQPRAS